MKVKIECVKCRGALMTLWGSNDYNNQRLICRCGASVVEIIDGELEAEWFTEEEEGV